MKVVNVVAVAGVVVLIGIAGCKQAKQEAPAPAPQAQQMPAGHPPVAGMSEAGAPAGGGISGKVVETMNSGGYTYVALQSGGKKTWVALPDSKVKVGQQITCQPGMEMKNFTSKTLNRTFDSIIFSGGIVK